MRRYILLFVFIIITIQCKKVEESDLSETDWLETKRSRHYDDYAKFIQKHPSSKNFKEAFAEYFFLTDSISDFRASSRFNAEINVNDQSQILFNSSLIEFDSVRNFAFHYLKDFNGNAEISSKLKYKVQIPETNSFDSISRGRFGFTFYKKQFPNRYIQPVIIEITKGIGDYKEYLSKKWYNKPYYELSKETKTEINALNENRLIFIDLTFLSDEE